LVKISTGLWLSLGSVPAALVGVALVGALLKKNSAATDRWVGRGLGIMLIVVACTLLAQPLLQRRLWRNDHASALMTRLRSWKRARPYLLVALGVIVGFLVGITSVGGGSLVMVALLLFYPTWTMRQRVGTDVFQGVLLSGAAAAGHWQLGTVSFPIVFQLLIGSVPGVLLGTRLVRVVPEGVLRPAVAGVLAFSGIRLF
jgi:uncharacterized membrane protein YfcA